MSADGPIYLERRKREDAALAKLRLIDERERDDNEGHHADYDGAIGTFLYSAGYHRLAKAYREHRGVDWWYA